MVVKNEATMNFKTSILSYFGELEDPRSQRNLTHPLINVVSIAILGAICGADDRVSIELYGKSKADWFGSFFGFKQGNSLS
jgi:hypothetical protein